MSENETLVGRCAYLSWEDGLTCQNYNPNTVSERTNFDPKKEEGQCKACSYIPLQVDCTGYKKMNPRTQKKIETRSKLLEKRWEAAE